MGVVEGWLEPERNKEWYGEGGEHKLDGDELFVPRLHDERPWLVIVATLPYQQPHVDDDAKAIQVRAVAAGFADAEVIDTRQTDELFCCSRVVLAGRYAARKDADAAVPRAKRARLSAYVKKGW